MKVVGVNLPFVFFQVNLWINQSKQTKLKNLFPFVLFFHSMFVSGFTRAHEFYFAHAEVELNEMTQRIECTISFTTHDFERYYLNDSLKLSSSINPFLLSGEMENILSKHFIFKLKGNITLKFSVEGIETMLNGTTNVYLSSELGNELPEEIIFDLFMDEIPSQQNKVSLTFRNQKTTYLFMPSARIQQLKIPIEK
jgi:hypothetical protein